MTEVDFLRWLDESHRKDMSRREFLRLAAASAAVVVLSSLPFPSRAAVKKKKIPPIGMGTWQTFNVGTNSALRDERTEVLREFFAQGGGMIDSSPMYGSSEEVVGYALKQLGYPKTLYAATKVWTPMEREGLQQVQESQQLWGVQRFDLLQVHNLVNWKDHLKTLFRMKDAGQLGAVGITTSHGRRHDEMERILRREPVDFVQLTYNMVDTRAEKLLAVAAERGIGVIVNRPFDGGDLFSSVRGKALPPWATEIDCHNWAPFFLKFIIAHPAVTCAIPATTGVAHMRENMGARLGRLPDAATRQRMLRYVQDL
jgi:diketogulonate reductase-like aldo/keto reductase